MLSEAVRKKFTSVFGGVPLLVRAPGRVNLIGEHTDYNQGFVMPAAIDKEIVCALAPNYGRKCRVLAMDLDQQVEFSPDQLRHSDKGWPNYVMGVMEQFARQGHPVQAFDCVFAGNIPLGAGLSSSAALECATAYAINLTFGCGLDKMELAKLSQRAENEFVGVRCGIMDQFASLFGRAERVMRLDCRDLTYEYFDFNMDEYRILLCDTGVKHALSSSEYNTRRQECEQGVEFLRRFDDRVHSLRDVNIGMLERHASALDPVVLKRCRYVVEENERVLDGCAKLQQEDLAGFGRNMYRTHLELSRDYEVSCAELDFLVQEAAESGCVIGARMMGGGFGGCTINLIRIEDMERFISEVSGKYRRQFSLDLKTYAVKIENGASKV
jgi:galactokinase